MHFEFVNVSKLMLYSIIENIYTVCYRSGIILWHLLRWCQSDNEELIVKGDHKLKTKTMTKDLNCFLCIIQYIRNNYAGISLISTKYWPMFLKRLLLYAEELIRADSVLAIRKSIKFTIHYSENAWKVLGL